MVSLYDNDIIFPEYVRFLKNKDNVIVINGSSGTWGLIDTPMLDKVNYCINNKISPISYITGLEDESDRQQLIDIFRTLIEEAMLKRSADKEFDIDIKRVEFKMTNKCNLKCLHCAASSDIGKPDLLSTEQMKAILDKIFDLNIEGLLLTGGEPLIRKDIIELLQYARKSFIGEINILTNGTFIDKEMALLLKKYANNISISVDGYDKESADFVRGKGVYSKIMSAIDNLKEAGFGKENIILTMTSTSQNFDHTEDFQSMCGKLDVTGGVRQFTAAGRGLENIGSIGIKDYLAYNPKSTEELETIRESLKCKLFCSGGITKLSIDEGGNLYPCLFLESEEYRFGNILKDDLKELLKSEVYHEFIRSRIKSSMLDTTDKCKDCDVRYFCSDSCAGMDLTYFKNEDIREERCRQMKPYLTKVVWDE
ncbi:MAG: Radical domain protein [Clostridia bacterium]|jgi:radical SAM protein with 4Fe4S-binding SPASM domain|nr:Radical domain protein [Clostridia bacterium]